MYVTDRQTNITKTGEMYVMIRRMDR